MRILVVFTGDFPGGSAASNRILTLAKELVKLGNTVKILLPYSNQLPICNQSKMLSSGCVENVSYEYTSGRRFASLSRVQRVLNNYIFFYFKWLFCCLKYRKETDIIWLYGVNWKYILTAKFLFRKVVYEQTEKPFINSHPSMIKKYITFYSFRYVDGFLLISDPLMDFFHKLSPNSLLKKIPTVAEDFKNNPIIEDYRYMIHAGAISEKKEGILTQIKAFHRVILGLKEDFRFIILGNLEVSPDKKDIEKYINENHLEDRIIFKGVVEKDLVEKYMLGASVAVLHRYDNEQNRYGFSTKLSEYLFACVPLIATPVGEIVNYFQDKKNILFTSPGNIEQLSYQIRWCLDNADKARIIAEEGRKIAMVEFSAKKLSKEICTFFSDLK